MFSYARRAFLGAAFCAIKLSAEYGTVRSLNCAVCGSVFRAENEK